MLLNENTYYVHITESGAAETEKGTPYIYLKIDVSHEAQGAEWIALPAVQQRTIYIYLSDAAWPNSVKKLQTLKYDGNPENPRFAVADFMATCKHEEYQGKTRERWELASWGEVEKKPITKQTAARLRALWKASNPPSPTPGTKPTPPTRPTSSPSPPSDDAPPPTEDLSGEEIPY